MPASPPLRLLGIRVPKREVKKMVVETMRRLPTLGPNSLPLVLWSVARMYGPYYVQCPHPRWTQALWIQAVPMLPLMTPEGLIQLLHGSARLAYVPSKAQLMVSVLVCDALSLC